MLLTGKKLQGGLPRKIMLLATNLSLEGQTDIYRGETRDVYILDDRLVSVATDRMTVFGHLFPEAIPHKGQVLNQLTEYFAKATEDIIPNWLTSVPDPNVIIGKKCKRFEVNFVIRGALIGHAWRVYEAGTHRVSGVNLPEGLQEYDLFDEPLITPSTKAQSGFEEDVSAGEIIEQELMSEAEFERLSIIARQLFIRGKQMARQRGLILADTKYEFGICDGEIYLIDEIHTPDCSRYFNAEEYERYLKERNEPPEHLSKEFMRQWALNQGFSGLEEQEVPVLPQDVINEISHRYVRLYEQLTGSEFQYPDSQLGIEERIQENIKTALAV